MIKVHKIRLYPTQAQEVYFRKACGTARFAYNWACARWKEANKARYEAVKAGVAKDDLPKLPSESELRKQLVLARSIDFPWMTEIAAGPVQEAVRQFGVAVKNMFDGKKAGRRVGEPQFKCKGKSKDSFCNTNQKCTVAGDTLELAQPRGLSEDIGLIKMAEPVRFTGRLMSCTISRRADQWFASISMEVTDETPAASTGGAIGIDLGIKTFATCFIC